MQSKFSPAILCILLLSFAVCIHAAAQSTKPVDTSGSSSSSAPSVQSDPVVPDQVPQPGQLGSPFPVEHWWNHFGLELGGGYAPVVSKGEGYFNKGFDVTGGLVDHLSPHLNLMVEAQFFGLEGPLAISNTDFALDFDGSYDLLARSSTSPYLIGGVGYYELSAYSPPCNEGLCFTLAAASSVGYNGGIGVRHRLFAEKNTEIFAEGRYHYIASSSSDYGQISLLPISAGIRW